MRIGNLDELAKSGHSDELANLIKSKDTKKLSAVGKWKNWWHYYKWYVICGIILLGIACDLMGNAMGLWKKSPDFQIAYVGSLALPQDTISALEEAFASLGDFSDLNLDFNGDGKVTVQINQYIIEHPYADVDAVFYDTVSEITLTGDISDCESYFFLMDDPERFQREYQVLADPDGNCPDDTDYSVDGKAFLWSDCPALSEITTLAETKAAGSQAILSGLYIGRRCFYNDARAKHTDKCSELWSCIVNK